MLCSKSNDTLPWDADDDELAPSEPLRDLALDGFPLWVSLVNDPDGWGELLCVPLCVPRGYLEGRAEGVRAFGLDRAELEALVPNALAWD